jgi:SAM-dependent methyltransferase
MASTRARTHPEVRGFDRAAATYERARPDYPVAALRFLGRVLPIRRGTTVVDLGSGTGKLTRLLAPLGAARVAVEPTPGMRRVFLETVPEVAVVDGTAEKMPLPTGFADAVVSAQAFHWFRPRPALREIRRVLRPGGGLGLLWNTRDDRLGWSRKLTELVEEYRTRQSRVWRERTGPGYQRVMLSPVFRDRTIGFTPLRYRAFRHRQVGPPELFVERTMSVSVIANLAPAKRREVAERVRELLADDPDTRGRRRIVLPYRTDVYWCHTRRRN